MKKRLKKIACIAAAIGLAVSGLAGCGKDDGGKGSAEDKDKTLGRYLEEEVPLSGKMGKILALTKLKDGSLAMLTESSDGSERTMWNSLDGGISWAEEYLPDGLKPQNCPYIERAVISPDGDLAALGMVGQQDLTVSGSLPVLYAKKGGEMEELSLELEEDDGKLLLLDLKFSDSGKLLVLDFDRNAHVVDPENGATLQTVEQTNESVVQIAGAGGRLLLLTDNGVLSYDVETGESRETDNVFSKEVAKGMADKAGFGFDRVVFAGGNDEKILFYCNQGGIYRHVYGGSVVEQAVNGEITTLGNPKMRPVALAALEDDSFLVACAVGENYKLLRYTYAPDIPAMPEKELKIYALQDDPTLRQAVAAYQKDHPDVYVNLQIGMSGDDSVTAADALRTLNTDIMGGNGPDLLALDGMPVNSYIEKGLLEDITGIVNQIGEENGLFENVKDTYQKDDKLYAVPLGFLIPILQGSEEIIGAAADLNALAEQLAKAKEADPGVKKVLEPSERQTLLEVFYHLANADWQQEDGTLSEEAVKTFLEQAKAISDAAIEENLNNDTVGIFSTAGGGTSAFLDAITLKPMNIFAKNAAAGVGWLGSVSTLSDLLAVNRLNGGSHAYLKNNENNVFLPYLSVGIVGKGENKALAEDFLKTLLGGTVQSTIDQAFPINRKGFENTQKNVYGEDGGISMSTGISMSSGDGVGQTLEIVWPNEQELAELTKLLEQADTPALMDDVIWNAVQEMGEKYLDGSLSLEDACSSIMQKVNLYLAE